MRCDGDAGVESVGLRLGQFLRLVLTAGEKQVEVVIIT